MDPRATFDRASDAPVATSLDTGTVFSRAFRGTRGPIRTRSPRPLRPRRREATRSSPVRDAFDRQRMRCSCSALSSGDCATDSWAERTTRVIRRIFPRSGTRGVARQGPRMSALRRSRLPTPRVAAQRGASIARTRRKRREFARDSYIREPRPPFTATPFRSFGAEACGGRASLGRAVCRLLQ